MKKFLLPWMAAAALVGCSKEIPADVSDAADNAPVEIRLASQATEITTRAPFEGTISSSNPLLALVPASATTGDYTNPYDNESAHAYMKFSDNGTSSVGFVGSDGTSSTPKYYPANGSAVYLCGLYPSTSWTSITTTASGSIDGKSDLMAAKEVATTKSDMQAGGTPKTLDFKHLLTKLDIKIKAESNAAVTAWGNVTSIQLTKVQAANPASSVSVTLKEGADGTDSSAPTFTAGSVAMSCYVWNTAYTDNAFSSQTQALTTSEANAAYVLCQPVTTAGSNASEYTLSVITSARSEAIDVPLSLVNNEGSELSGTNTMGQAFAVTLTFKATQIEAKATVTDWVNGGTASGDIQ
jgi:hypothetical protein